MIDIKVVIVGCFLSVLFMLAPIYQMKKLRGRKKRGSSFLEKEQIRLDYLEKLYLAGFFGLFTSLFLTYKYFIH